MSSIIKKNELVTQEPETTRDDIKKRPRSDSSEIEHCAQRPKTQGIDQYTYPFATTIEQTTGFIDDLPDSSVGHMWDDFISEPGVGDRVLCADGFADFFRLLMKDDAVRSIASRVLITLFESEIKGCEEGIYTR